MTRPARKRLLNTAQFDALKQAVASAGGDAKLMEMDVSETDVHVLYPPELAPIIVNVLPGILADRRDRSIDASLFAPLVAYLATAAPAVADAVSLHGTGDGHVLRYPAAHETVITAGLADAGVLSAALDERKVSARAGVETIYNSKLEVGFVADLPNGQATFQIRVKDQPNWLTAKALYQDAIAAGQGSAAGARMRDVTDAIHLLTFDQANAVLADMASYGAALMGANWALKDAIKAAASVADLEAIDLTAGWP